MAEQLGLVAQGDSAVLMVSDDLLQPGSKSYLLSCTPISYTHCEGSVVHGHSQHKSTSHV